MASSSSHNPRGDIVIPRPTQDIEEAARQLADYSDALVRIAEKTKKLRESKTAVEKKLQAWLTERHVPIDIPVSLGPGLTATLVEGHQSEGINENMITRHVIGYFQKAGLPGDQANKKASELVDHIYDNRRVEQVTKLKFIDTIKKAEAKKRKKAAGTKKMPAKKKKNNNVPAAATATTTASQQ